MIEAHKNISQKQLTSVSTKATDLSQYQSNWPVSEATDISQSQEQLISVSTKETDQ